MLVWDDRSIDMFGLTDQTLTGLVGDIDRAIHPDDRPAVREALQEAIDQSGRLDAEFRVVWPDGTVHWVFARGQVLVDGSGRPVRMIGTNADVTGAREAAQEQFVDTQRMAGLIAVARALGDAATVEHVLAVVTEHGAAVLDTDGVLIGLGAPDGSVVRTLSTAFFAEEMRTQIADLPADFPSPLVESALRGTSHFVPDRATGVAQFPGSEEMWTESGVEAAATVPLTAEGRVFGGLALVLARPHAWRSADRELLEALGRSPRRPSTASGRTRRRRRPRPRWPGCRRPCSGRLLTVAAASPTTCTGDLRYLPAAADAQIGGDWYDAFLPATAPPAWSSATSPVTTARPRPPWARCATCCAASAWATRRDPARGSSHAGPGDHRAGRRHAGDRAHRPGGAGRRRPGRRPADGCAGASAGHPPPLLVDEHGQVRLLEGRTCCWAWTTR